VRPARPSRPATFTVGVLLAATACGGSGSGRGVLEGACGGIFDKQALDELSRASEAGELREATSGDTYAWVADALREREAPADSCRIEAGAGEGSPATAVQVRFSIGGDPLFPEAERRSTSGYKAYDLGGGTQAVGETRRSAVRFPCVLEGRKQWITGEILGRAELSDVTSFQVLFSSVGKLEGALKCGNVIRLPEASNMRALPLG
jgi:hypothetical protein